MENIIYKAASKSQIPNNCSKLVNTPSPHILPILTQLVHTQSPALSHLDLTFPVFADLLDTKTSSFYGLEIGYWAAFKEFQKTRYL